MNPDLSKERKGASFSADQLSNILYGGPQKVKRRKYMEHLIRSDPAFEWPNTNFLSREELFEVALKNNVAFLKKIRELGITNFEDFFVASSTALPQGLGPLSLHDTAFIPPIRLQGSEEQIKKWLPKAENYQIIGCYAQTELGHGSFVRGIETRADYDIATKEFVLHTPTVSATKWWAGTMGVCATHALVLAQLYSNGKNHGLHPFIVPLRDEETFKVLPGISVGDIGPKFGFSSVDNGYLRLDNYRIPRDNLLRKTGYVTDDGTYVKPKSSKLVYGGMLGIRARLPMSGAVNLAKAVTIATRYSCVRHQSELKPGDPEPQVLDFQTQQHKLFPLLASTFGFWFTATWLRNFYEEVLAEMHQGEFGRLAEIHVLSAGMKALFNWKAHEGVEMCRLACGGHGYSSASGLPDLYAGQVANSTAEGETVVLLLQTGKYLAKCYMSLKQGRALDPSATYFSKEKFAPLPTMEKLNVQSLVTALQFRSVKQLEYVGGKLQKAFMSGADQSDALNKHTVYLVDAAKAHIAAVTMKAYADNVEQIAATNPALGKVLIRLCLTYGISEILDNAGDYVQHGYLNSASLEGLSDRRLALYTEIRPDAIAIVDSFEFSDHILNSILGRYDGNVYENLFKWAQESPLNKDEVHESYHKHLKNLRVAKL